MRTVDFERATEAARASVNAWTAARTRNRIEEIVPPDVLTSRTRLVLVNALYLKARWAEPFVAHEVRPGPFHLADGSVVEVPMMREPLRHALHGRGDGWQAVRLPYAGMGLAMTLVVPDEGRAADVEAALGGGALAEMIGSVRRTPLDVSLPRWTFRTRLGLGDALAALGMPSLFDPQTVDLGAMTSPREDLCVDAVLQEVFVAVDEHGTEAAAATAVAVMELVAVRERLRLVVDRPFWFAIHDVEHGAPLFVGRVEDPRG
jgi:serpin B